MSELSTKYRTHTCGELRAEHASKPAMVTICGHVDRHLEDGSILVRDRYGKTLVTVGPDALPYVADRIGKLNVEDVVQVKGAVAAREAPDATTPTGGVCLRATAIEVLSDAAPLPESFAPGAVATPSAEERLAFRQLYLRRPEVQERLGFRSRVTRETREFFLARSFLEIETPQLFWYDPVAREPEIVPAGPRRAFALPGGPVVLDQYLKAGQFDSFFQFVPITAHEEHPTPLHAVEFTGLDVNLAFADTEDFYKLCEDLLAHLWKTVAGVELKTPFARVSYDEAILRFGTDKPDLRFGMELVDLPGAAPAGRAARAIVAPGAAKLADADLAELTKSPTVKTGPVASVLWARVTEQGLEGPGAALGAETLKPLGAKPGDVVVVCVAERPDFAARAAGAARRALGGKLGLAPKGAPPRPVWVHTYPFMELSDEGNYEAGVVVFARLDSDEDVKLAAKGLPESRRLIKSRAFDLVIDGVELASGYVGNHDLELQKTIWKNVSQIEGGDLYRLRAPIEAHRFGLPPHGGINIGFERLVVKLLGIDAIDEVIAFPKDAVARDPMLDAPGPVPRDAVAHLLEEPDFPETIEQILAKEKEA